MRSYPVQGFKPVDSRNFKAALATTVLASLVACGGGGGSGSASNSNPPGGGSPPVATSATLSGTAATGAAFAGAAVTVIDKRGEVVCTTTTDAQGAYACQLPTSVQAPLVIAARRDDLTLYSTTASTGDAVANVTPLTTVVVSRLSPDGNPASLAGAIQTSAVTVSEATLQQKVGELLDALRPLLSAIGDSLDPISGKFSANGTGHDRVLDAINVSVRPDGSAASVEITVKTIPGSDGSAPVSITFRSNEAIATGLPAITADQLVPTSTTQLVSSFFERWNACFALPLTQRVGTATSDSVSAVGGAGDVVAAACKGLFVGNDPANYYGNGLRVGRDANNVGSFSGLFRAGATGVRFDRANLEFAKANGDVVVSYRSSDVAGNVDYDTITLRHVDGALYTPGNGNDFNVLVAPWVQSRDLINSPKYSYLSTAYLVNIVKNAGVAKVLVTTPFNKTLEYRSNPGTPYMTIYSNGALSSTPNYRLSAAWSDIGTAGNPVDKMGSLVIANPQLTDEQLRALPDQSVWKLEFFDGAGNSLGVQNHRTIARALTMAETRQTQMADFSPALREEIRSGSSATGHIELGAAPDNIVDLSAEGEQAGWVVPDGAIAPATVSVYGSNFSDSVNVPAAARKAIVPCSSDGPSDLHCDPSTPGAYNPGLWLYTFELVSRAPRQLQINKSLSLDLIQ